MIKWSDISDDIGKFLDANPDLEMRLWVAWKCGVLLEYLDGSDYVSPIETVDNRASFLFVLLRRPLFDETLRMAKLMGG